MRQYPLHTDALKWMKNYTIQDGVWICQKTQTREKKMVFTIATNDYHQHNLCTFWELRGVSKSVHCRWVDHMSHGQSYPVFHSNHTKSSFNLRLAILSVESPDIYLSITSYFNGCNESEDIAVHSQQFEHTHTNAHFIRSTLFVLHRIPTFWC